MQHDAEKSSLYQQRERGGEKRTGEQERVKALTWKQSDLSGLAYHRSALLSLVIKRIWRNCGVLLG